MEICLLKILFQLFSLWNWIRSSFNNFPNLIQNTLTHVLPLMFFPFRTINTLVNFWFLMKQRMKHKELIKWNQWKCKVQNIRIRFLRRPHQFKSLQKFPLSLKDHLFIIFKNILLQQSEELSELTGLRKCLNIYLWPNRCGKYSETPKNTQNNSFRWS